MRSIILSAVLVTALVLTAIAPREAAAQDRGRDAVCVYEHANFNGWEQCFGVGDSINDLGNRRNQISSVRVIGRAEITLYEHPNFGGRELRIGNDVRDLSRGDRFWNDETDSLRVTAPGYRGGRDQDSHRADRVCVYEHANYQGRSECWGAGEDVPDLERQGWNDRISSIRIFGRTRVAIFEHVDFQGRRLVLGRDLPDLNRIDADGRSSWNDRISSLRVSGER